MERDYQWLDGISLTAFSMLETTTNAHVMPNCCQDYRQSIWGHPRDGRLEKSFITRE